MQTFMPFSNFTETSECLDNARLGKQRLEVKQIYNATVSPGAGWYNHPATRGWRNHRVGLLVYGIVICREWASRGKVDNLEREFISLLPKDFDIKTVEYPDWISDERVNSSHRARLLAKGEIDRVAWRIKKTGFPSQGWLAARLFPKLNELKLADVKLANDMLDDMGIPKAPANHYSQFCWKERPSDDYFWPIIQR